MLNSATSSTKKQVCLWWGSVGGDIVNWEVRLRSVGNGVLWDRIYGGSDGENGENRNGESWGNGNGIQGRKLNSTKLNHNHETTGRTQERQGESDGRTTMKGENSGRSRDYESESGTERV